MIEEITVVCVSWKDSGDLYDAVASLAQARARDAGASARASRS